MSRIMSPYTRRPCPDCMHPDCLAMADDEAGRQWELDHPDGISAEELASMDRYAAEACREEGH